MTNHKAILVKEVMLLRLYHKIEFDKKGYNDVKEYLFGYNYVELLNMKHKLQAMGKPEVTYPNW